MALLRDEDALKAIKPGAIRDYAITHGWKFAEQFGDHRETYVSEGDALVLPSNGYAEGYAAAIAAALERLAAKERRPVEDVYRDVVAGYENKSSDIRAQQTDFLAFYRCFRKRPGMYIGRSSIFSFEGYMAGWMSSGVEIKNLDLFFEFARVWIPERYKMTPVAGWALPMLFHSHGSEDQALQLFFYEFERFLKDKGITLDAE